MPPFASTVVGSYPRNTSVEDTMKKPSLSRTEIDELIEWAARDQADLGLDVITDGEGYRENMYYFYQKRLDGVTFDAMVKQSFGIAGFAIECARVIGEIKNPRFHLARNWKLARDTAPPRFRVKQTVTGPHVLTRFSVNERPDSLPRRAGALPRLRGGLGRGASRRDRRRLRLRAVRRADVDRVARRQRGPPTSSTS